MRTFICDHRSGCSVEDKNHRWPKLPICVGNDYSGVRLHIAILSKCMGNLNSSHNVMKNNKIHCFPQASCVVVTPCVYGGFWSRLERPRH